MKKRVELSIHTNMSGTIGINEIDDYINAAMLDYMPALAITDNSSVQSFPRAYNAVSRQGGIKIIYGVEMFYSVGCELFTFTVLAKNKKGLKEMYKIISEAYTKNKHLVSLSDINRENLILGISLLSEPIYRIIEGKSESIIKDIIKQFDYVMLPPMGHFHFFIQHKEIKNTREAMSITENIIKLCEKLDVIPVASDAARYVYTDDGECEKILLMEKGLASYRDRPKLHFRNTQEMLDEFSFLSAEKADEIVIENTNKVADMVADTFAPYEENVEYPNDIEKLTELTYVEAYKKYGKELPDVVKERIEFELNIIGQNSKSVTQYLVLAALVEKASIKGFVVGSRGSVGASLVAHLIGITNINPLSAHYYCKECNYLEFHCDENCGVDLPNKKCPLCNNSLVKDGFNIPAETFMGLDGTRDVDIDLNFPMEYYDVFEDLNAMLSNNVVKCGITNSISYEDSWNMLKRYCKKEKLKYSSIYEDILCDKLSKIKKATTLHPGGAFIIPESNDVFDFSPIQYASNNEKEPIITHLHFADLSNYLLKVDLYEHSTQSMIYQLEKSTGVASYQIPLDDQKTMNSIKEGKNAGIPELSDEFTQHLVITLNPNKFDDLVRIVGFSHGTDVWYDNAENLIDSGICMSDTISTRDDVTLTLKKYDVDRETAFKISERIRKGKGLTDEQYQCLYSKGVPNYFLDSCNKIKYLFPRAHCVDLAEFAFKLSYYKSYYPLDFYCTYLNMNLQDFKCELVKPYLKSIDKKIEKLRKAGEEIPEILFVFKEFLESGYKFSSKSLLKNIERIVVENGELKAI